MRIHDDSERYEETPSQVGVENCSYQRLISYFEWIKMDNWLTARRLLFLISVIVILNAPKVHAIRCYQCSSDTDKENDICGAYAPFDTVRNVPVECYNDEATTPGIFCVKITKQGPRGFIWDGRWRTVIRRCALVSETGVTTYCNWGHDENGVYWEECYCGTDGCNGASATRIIGILTLIPLIVALHNLLTP